MSSNWNIFTGTNTFKYAEFESENFPRRKPAVFSQNAILSSLISQQIYTIISLKTTNLVDYINQNDQLKSTLVKGHHVTYLCIL
jgi:hypothetical protein